MMCGESARRSNSTNSHWELLVWSCRRRNDLEHLGEVEQVRLQRHGWQVHQAIIHTVTNECASAERTRGPRDSPGSRRGFGMDGQRRHARSLGWGRGAIGRTPGPREGKTDGEARSERPIPL